MISSLFWFGTLVAAWLSERQVGGPSRHHRGSRSHTPLSLGGLIPDTRLALPVPASFTMRKRVAPTRSRAHERHGWHFGWGGKSLRNADIMRTRPTTPGPNANQSHSLTNYVMCVITVNIVNCVNSGGWAHYGTHPTTPTTTHIPVFPRVCACTRGIA